MHGRFSVGLLLGAAIFVAVSSDSALAQGPLPAPSGNGFFFRQGSYDLAVPPFGGYSPDAGATFGFGIGGGQGGARGMTSGAASGTFSNGAPGGVFDATQQPYVLGTAPVLGDRGVSPLAGRLERLKNNEQPRKAPRAALANQAAQAAPAKGAVRAGAPGAARGGNQLAAREAVDGAPRLSVAEIRRLQAAEKDAAVDEVQTLRARAEQAAADGKPAMAKAFYQQAARRADGPLKAELNERAKSVKKAR